MRYWLIILALFASLSECRNVTAQATTASQPTLEAGFVWLFDGQTLSGWEGNEKAFRVESKSIVAGNLQSDIPNNEFLCTTAQYGDFDLRLEAKLIGQGDNAGVQFRSERIPNHHEVIGYQCDIGLMGKDKSIWGSLYDESRRKKFLAEAPADSIKRIHPGQWNQIRIVAQGPQIQIFVNEHLTVDYIEKDDAIAQTGVIALQIHSGRPAEAWYRHIRIKQLSTK